MTLLPVHILLVACSASLLNQVTVVPYEHRFLEPSEIAVWHVTNLLLVTIDGEGSVDCFRLSDGTRVGGLRLPQYRYRQMDTIATADDRLVCVAEAPQGSRVVVWQLPDGRRLSDFVVDNTCLRLVSRDAAGKNIVCTDAVCDDIVAVNLDEARVAWRQARGYCNGVACNTDLSRVVRFTGASAEGRDSDGGERWLVRATEDLYLEEYVFPDRSASNVAVALESSDRGPAKYVRGLSCADGSTAWRREIHEWGDLLAVSADGSRQLFWAGGWLLATRLPGNHEQHARWLSGRPEAQYTADGKYVVLGAPLATIKEDNTNHVYVYGRRTNEFDVLDARDLSPVAHIRAGGPVEK